MLTPFLALIFVVLVYLLGVYNGRKSAESELLQRLGVPEGYYITSVSYRRIVK